MDDFKLDELKELLQDYGIIEKEDVLSLAVWNKNELLIKMVEIIK